MSVELQSSFVKLLQKSKNLLALSGGVDSSALFFLLLEEGIPFDVACVNYQTRPNSDKEALHVKNLATKHNKKSYILTCKLKKSNFEHKAREVRYGFFEKIINENGYENLILAHQLDDRFEWFMMQFCKGAGVSELAGFDSVEKREHYSIIRPLWQTTKNTLQTYLDEKNLPYFEDESNFDTKYRRNFMRKLTAPLINTHELGIKNSLHFLIKDAKVLDGTFLHVRKKLFIYKLTDEQIDIRLIDKAVKKLGFVMSQESRKEALKKNAILSRTVAVGKNETHGFIAPFVKIVMPKAFKEKCRIAKIPLHVRGYLYSEDVWVDL